MTTKPTNEPKRVIEPKREMDDATRIGRLVRTIQRIEKERDAELADAPQSIHARAANRLAKAYEGVPAHIVNAAVAAVDAMKPKAPSEEAGALLSKLAE
ncbi:MAG TPA: hypothetical protein VGK73_11230 [Polyangiaceae bacterium]